MKTNHLQDMFKYFCIECATTKDAIRNGDSNQYSAMVQKAANQDG